MANATSIHLVAGCVFCDIIAGAVSAHVVFEDADTMAFLDRAPLMPGHVLVVPRTHIETLGELPLPQVGLLFETVQRIATAVESGMRAEGTFLAINIRISQSVPHLHTHVVPRRRKDGLRGFFWPRTKYASPDEAAAYATKIKSAL